MKMNKESKNLIYKESEKHKGITLIALVVTIIVLLILAGVSIQMLVGEGGILTNAREARDRTGEADAKEELDMYLMEYAGNKNLGDTTDLKTFLESKGYTVKEREDGKLEVGKDGYKFIVDPDTLSSQLKEKGKPEIKVQVSEQYGEGKVTVTVEVTNEDELGTVDNVTLTTPDGNILEGNVKNGIATFEIEKNGTYTVEAKATTDGTQKSIKQDVKVDKITANISGALEYGTIEVIWVDENNNIQDTPESPVNHLNGMKKVKWTKGEDGNWTEDEEEPLDANWYNYKTLENTTSKEDNLTSEWANAKNPEDGSYFVWIPRYAYRITYYKDQKAYENGEEPLAYFDGNGLVNPKEARIIRLNGDSIDEGNKMDEKIQTVTRDGKSYIVHPAFYGSGSEDLGGGFGSGKGIEGIWVAKYEMSQEMKLGNSWERNDTAAPSGTGRNNGNILTSDKIRAVSKPATSTYNTGNCVRSWTYINIANCYTNSLNYDIAKESHLMKNSEWGAVVYLAHSQFGRNGQLITKNASKLTGCGKSSKDFYNTSNGALASTTGNVYGIYDVNGGSHEYVASYNKEYTGEYFTDINYLDENGSNFANECKKSSNGSSTKYVTAYSNTEDKNTMVTLEYKVGKIGDATKEILAHKLSPYDNGGYHWFDSKGYLANINSPFFGYSQHLNGNYRDDKGCFEINAFSGGSSEDVTYRVVLAK